MVALTIKQIRRIEKFIDYHVRRVLRETKRFNSQIKKQALLDQKAFKNTFEYKSEKLQTAQEKRSQYYFERRDEKLIQVRNRTVERRIEKNIIVNPRAGRPRLTVSPELLK